MSPCGPLHPAWPCYLFSLEQVDEGGQDHGAQVGAQELSDAEETSAEASASCHPHIPFPASRGWLQALTPSWLTALLPGEAESPEFKAASASCWADHMHVYTREVPAGTKQIPCTGEMD